LPGWNLKRALYKLSTMVRLIVAGLVLISGGAFAQWPSLDSPLPRQGGGEKDAALIISIGDYAFLPDVPGAKENATSWYQHLTVTRGIPGTQVIWLQDSEATLEGFKDALSAVVAKTKPGGILWVLYIGHGAPTENGDDGELVGADAQNVIRSLYPRSLPRKELLKAIDAGKQARSVVFLDACFSGQSTAGVQLASGTMPTLPEREVSLKAAKPVVLLTAGTSRQFAGALPGMQVPAFSYLALGALRGWADQDRDRAVTAGEAVSFMNEVMSTTVKGRTQTPQLNPESSAGVILGKASKDAAALPLNEVVLWLRGSAGGAVVEPAPVAKSTGPKISSGTVSAVMGGLSIATKPGGARLELVDPQGRASAVAAPLMNPKVAVGRWKVRAFKDGFGVEEVEVEVLPDETAMLTLTLKAQVALEVTGTPAGALVTVTGPGLKNEGGLPWKAEGLTSGEYRVTVTRDGYTPFEWSRIIAPGAFERVSVKLDRADVKRAGSTRVDPRTGITWVWMPPGSFPMGCVEGDAECESDEKKPAVMTSVEGFWMAKTETTVLQYEKCASEGSCSSEIKTQDVEPVKTCNWKNGRYTHPMNCLNWVEATAFCKWAGGKLPSATEWEYAAKAGQAVIFPWGRERPDGERANFCDKNCPNALIDADRQKWESKGWVSKQVNDGWAGTAPVGTYRSGNTAWGLAGMSGNVWEWTLSDYDDKNKELRGGSWYDSPSELRSSIRGRTGPSGRDVDIGFRCAQ